jgi:hypothetical protein
VPLAIVSGQRDLEVLQGLLDVQGLYAAAVAVLALSAGLFALAVQERALRVSVGPKVF